MIFNYNTNEYSAEEEIHSEVEDPECIEQLN